MTAQVRITVHTIVDRTFRQRSMVPALETGGGPSQNAPNWKTKDAVVRSAHLIQPLCALLLSSVLAVPVSASSKLKVGDVPPDKFGKSASGERIHLADYRGKVVVISFWASWCPPCRKELPIMINLQRVAT